MAKVVLKLDGSQHEFDCPVDKTILETAEKEGLDVPASCHSGTCGACECRLVTGTVDMDNPMALSDEDIEEGMILACQAKCTSDTVNVVFDN